MLLLFSLVSALLIHTSISSQNNNRVYDEEKSRGFSFSAIEGRRTDTHSHTSNNCSQVWTFYDEESRECKCGQSYNEVVRSDCSSNNSKITITSLKLQYCHCMSYDITTNTTVMGYCPYACIASLLDVGNYHPLPLNHTDLNRLCAPWKRQGQLCSECSEGHGPAIYSYYDQCFPCSNSTSQKLHMAFLVAARALLPLTIMCVIITLFRINVLFPPWSIFVLTCQFFSAPPLMQSVFSRVLYTHSQEYKVGAMIISALYSPWNLDFFRGIYTPRCFSPHLKNIDIALLEFFIGLYPLLLIVLFYWFFKLHDKRNSMIVALWKPFNMCLSCLHIKPSTRSSLIHAFSTFILLSYTKIGIATFYILVPVRVVRPQGDYSLYVYIDPNLKYFQPPHVYYAIFTLILGGLILLFPITLLGLYPFRFFQMCLSSCHLRSHTLTAFTDAFQGCYKDSSDGGQDLRYFSVVQFLLRFKMLILFGCTQDVIIYAFGSTVVLFLYFGSFVITQPYKTVMYNRSDVSLLIPVLLFNIVVIFHSITPHSRTFLISTQEAMISICLLSPVVYLCVWVGIKLKRKCLPLRNNRQFQQIHFNVQNMFHE